MSRQDLNEADMLLFLLARDVRRLAKRDRQYWRGYNVLSRARRYVREQLEVRA